jgi:DnaJ-class molecular chaperone
MTPATLLSELTTPLSPEETLIARGATPAQAHNRMLCPVCLGSGKNEVRKKRQGYLRSTCGQCKGTGQRGGRR